MPRGGRRQGAGRPKGTGKFGEATKAVRVPISMIEKIMGFIDRKGLTFPIHANKGKGHATVKKDEVSSEQVDLTSFLVPDPKTTLFMKAADDSMSGAGILANDLLILDNQAGPQNGNVVIVSVNGKLVPRRYVVKNKKVELKPENTKFAATAVADESALEIWGIVQHVIRSV